MRLQLWRWFGENKDSIHAVVSILQVIVLGAGVFFTVNELVVKDRAAEQAKVQRVFDMYREARDVRMLLDKPSGVSEAEIKEVDFVLSETQACVDANQCDSTLAQRLFCAMAFRAADISMGLFMTEFHEDRSALVLVPFHYAVGCYPDYLLIDDYVPTWIPLYSQSYDSDLMGFYEEFGPQEPPSN